MVIIFLVLISIGVVALIDKADDADIRRWVAKRGEQVIEIDARLIWTGPFHLNGRHQRIYRVKTVNNIYWFRTGNFISDDIEQELPNGNYVTLQ